MDTRELENNKIVLVPTDFSDICRNAINHGVKLARNGGFKVCILHVITGETRSLLKKMQVGAEYIDWKLNEYRKYYEKKYGVTVETMAVEGNIFTTINEVARQIGAGVMILGTHGKRGMQQVFGSYALRVVLDSPIPVIVVQKITYRERYRNIVLPVSSMDESLLALKLAKVISGLLDVKFHILPLPEKEAGLKNLLPAITSRVTGIFEEGKMPDIVVTPYKTSNFAAEVIAFTIAQKADMIMMINRPHAVASGLGLSSWNERLMFNEAQIPVMCINPGFMS
jgi:nucleotide-binding universal stress UspA family protein